MKKIRKGIRVMKMIKKKMMTLETVTRRRMNRIRNKEEENEKESIIEESG